MVTRISNLSTEVAEVPNVVVHCVSIFDNPTTSVAKEPNVVVPFVVLTRLLQLPKFLLCRKLLVVL